MKKNEEKSKTWDPPNSAPLKQVSSCPPPPNELSDGGQEPGGGVGWEYKYEKINYKRGGEYMNEEREEIKTKKEKDEVQVTVSHEHENKLQRLIEKISEGFDMARVTRKHVLAHIIDKCYMRFDEEDIQAIRKSTITDIALLDQAYREMKRTGAVPEEIREYLWKSRSLTQVPKKPKKSRQANHINDMVLKEDIA